MDEQLEARVRRLEDLAAINQIFIDYIDALDWGKGAQYGAQFAEDGEILLGPLRAKGPAEIEKLLDQILNGREKVGEAFHIVSSPMIELDGDTAKASVMWTVIAKDANGQPTVTLLGRHVDDLVREKGEWKIKKRRGKLDIPSAIGSIRPSS